MSDAGHAPDKAVLAAGVEWLYRTVQPPGALIQHGRSRLSGDRRYTFWPVGYAGFPVVCVQVAAPVMREGDLLNPIGPGEMASQAAALAEAGAEVARQWNGDGYESGSFGLARMAHPSLLAAARLYSEGCSEHPSERVFCSCGWYQAGSALITDPDWPASEASHA